MNIVEKIFKDTQSALRLVEIRHKYKLRQNIRMSDKEYDKFINDTILNIARSRVILDFALGLIKELDESDKKIQKGKKPANYVILMARFEEAWNKYMGDNDGHKEIKHSELDLQADGKGEREEGKKA